MDEAGEKKENSGADKGEDDIFDDLDAFFCAAAASDPGAVSEAAKNVTIQADAKAATGTFAQAKSGTGTFPQTKSGTGLFARMKSATGIFPAPAEPPAASQGETAQADFDVGAAYDSAPHLDGKFIAIDAPGEEAGAPFILIPAHIHSFLPWWGWLSILLSLLLLAAGVVIMPILSLNRLTARLGDDNPANVQAAMQRLVRTGDGRTVGRLYDMAASPETGMNTRLRAIDTLGLIPASEADRALLRLELSGNTDNTVREAAVAARKQRNLTRERVRYR